MGHLRDHVFEVITIDVDAQQLHDIRLGFGVPERLFSCHTATVDGYVIEGHVPWDVIVRLLSERPDLVGLAVPGMPIGSAGMEGPNPQPYNILAFSGNGEVSLYASR